MPRPLPLMSGNFDSPPASDSREHDRADRIIREILNSTQSPDDISPSGELYRAIERFHRRRSGAETPELSQMSSQQQEDRRRRLREPGAASPLFVLPPRSPPDEQSPRERAATRLAGMAPRRGSGRPRMPPSDRYLNSHRTVLGESSASSNGLADLQHAGQQLEQASSNLRSLLDSPVPHLSSPLDPDYSGEAEHNRRAKRRKLDTDKLETGFKGFSYGKYGQVEPGKLKMEIVSCDGGIYQDHGENYAAENVLKNDQSVYCTKANRCNLILRHQGATVFHLKELIIKAPRNGYTAPVQAGMVFISMTSDDLLTRTAQYQIQYSPPRPRRPGSRSNDLPPVSIRYNADGTGTVMTAEQRRLRNLYEIGVQDDECDRRTAQLPADFTENTPPFQVTTECSDTEDDAPPSRIRHRSLGRIASNFPGLRFEDSDPSSEDDDGQNTPPWHESYLGIGTPRLRRRETASNITLAEAAEAAQNATQEAVRAVGGELMAPHARFFIERDKSKCTVKFDPPVSGRFILLKMWSPQHTPGGNIDIQSVVAKGFAGPRFFPAVTLR